MINFTINENEFLKENLQEALEEHKSEYERAILIMSKIGVAVDGLRDDIVNIEAILQKLSG